MEFRILGRLEVADAGGLRPLGGPRQRLVLAHLLLRPGRRVSAEQLIDEVWGERVPRAARNSLQSYVSHLRDALGPGRLDGGVRGYLLTVEPGELDADRFEQLAREAGQLASGDPAAAIDVSREALGLWRGPVLDDLSGQPSLQLEIARLEELRLVVTEELLAAELALGRHRELVPELQALVGRHPLREGLWAKLMTALYRSGRQAEALDAYRRARNVLVEEVGLEPSPDLRSLHAGILGHDPVLELDVQPRDRVQTALVGRAPELEALASALGGLREGSGTVVSIWGEPGIGKSRLVAEAERRLGGHVRFLVGHAAPYTRAVPYNPVREQLRGWLGCGANEPEARVRRELASKVAVALGADADEAYPFLASLLGVALEPAQRWRLEELARDAIRAETAHWLRRLVVTLARERPVCLVVEDLQWSDEATLALLGDALPLVEQEAVAFVLVHRREPGRPAAAFLRDARVHLGARLRELELLPLPAAEVRTLIAATVGAEPAPELVALVTARVGGNPYFVGEVLRDLRERGALEREAGSVRLVGGASVPTALEEALRARLERLDAEARELITTAAVIGRSFDLPLIERLVPRARVLPILSELGSLDLVEETRGPSGAAGYRFRHVLVEEAAYAGLADSAQRRELHQRVGEALEDLHGDARAEVYGLLARHFTEANDPERAVEYLLKAGDAARAVYADEEAARLYRRALGLMTSAAEQGRARQTLLRLALTHHLAFDFAAAGEALAEAFSLATPVPRRMEPSEALAWATPAGWPADATAPGLNDSDLVQWVVHNLFRGLVAIGHDFEIEPDLAERFSVSADGLTYRFALRPDAVWSDGRPVTAGDFAFTFARLVEDDLPAARLEDVRAEAIDDRTLELRLREPQSHFLHALGQPLLFAWPRHVVERLGRRWYAEVPLVGNGPFVLAARRLGAEPGSHGRITLRAAPGWYGARGNVGEVTIDLEPSPQAAGERWRDGEYDLIYEVLAALAGDVVTDTTVVDHAPGGFTDFLGLDARRPPFDDARVRRAAAHAIDRREPARLLGGTPAITGGLLPPPMPGHSPRVAPPYDLERARALLAEAGDRPGPDGEVVLAHFAIWTETAAALAAQLGAAGFRVRPLPVTSVAELEAAIEDVAHAYIWSWDADIPDPARGFLEPLLRSAPSLHRGDELEQLLRRAASLRDLDERLRACREFERLWIGEQAAVVPLVYSDRILVRRPWLTGLWANALTKSSFAEAVVLARRPPASRP